MSMAAILETLGEETSNENILCTPNLKLCHALYGHLMDMNRYSIRDCIDWLGNLEGTRPSLARIGDINIVEASIIRSVPSISFIPTRIYLWVKPYFTLVSVEAFSYRGDCVVGKWFWTYLVSWQVLSVLQKCFTRVCSICFDVRGVRPSLFSVWNVVFSLRFPVTNV